MPIKALPVDIKQYIKKNNSTGLRLNLLINAERNACIVFVSTMILKTAPIIKMKKINDADCCNPLGTEVKILRSDVGDA